MTPAPDAEILALRPSTAARAGSMPARGLVTFVRWHRMAVVAGPEELVVRNVWRSCRLARADILALEQVFPLPGGSRGRARSGPAGGVAGAGGWGNIGRRAVLGWGA